MLAEVCVYVYVEVWPENVLTELRVFGQKYSEQKRQTEITRTRSAQSQC